MLDTLKDKTGYNFDNFVETINVQPKTILLKEGDISKNIYFIEHGVLRMWFNKEGKDITFQLFFEDKFVASIESFLNNTPSLFNIESIEQSEITVISKKNFESITHLYPSLKDELFNLLTERLKNYTHLFLSRIKDSPQERYKELVRTRPEIIQRVPQHYIASYLGVTPISLSRIRNRR